MYIAIILLCLTMVSMHFTTMLYAKYRSAGEMEDSAKAISFGSLTLTETGDFGTDGTLMIIPGVPLTKKAVVNFTGSEAATFAFVEVELSDHWKTTDNVTFTIKNGDKDLMSWSVDGYWTFLLTAGTDSTKSYVYYHELAPNAVLTGADIIENEGEIVVSDQITKSEMTGLTGVYINLSAAVVQSGGFDDANAAWTSLQGKGE